MLYFWDRFLEVKRTRKYRSYQEREQKENLAMSQQVKERYVAIKVLVFNKFKYFLNIKNKTKYTLLSDEVIDCTNSRDGLKLSLYTDGKKLYVRENDEFNLKFEEIN